MKNIKFRVWDARKNVVSRNKVFMMSEDIYFFFVPLKILLDGVFMTECLAIVFVLVNMMRLCNSPDSTTRTVKRYMRGIK